ncbi:MAG TPA: glycosyltransferase family A protein [Thermoanaerobaculia bacterium]|nr:glycosyltransferase family A protein [Thermoanaerobaculia bacterium]
MTEPLFTVVIPTFERPETLFAVLEAVGKQESPPPFEVVVVDDGSRDETAARLHAFRPAHPFRAISQANRGPASARNRGVREARGRCILFLGDDTVPEARLLAVHAEAHAEKRGHPVAVLGYTTWPRDRRVSPFLHHINEYGLQFGYALIRDPESVPFNFFYTSNISVPRELLLAEGLFDTTFPHAAWEDIELAYRLMRRGMKIVYRPAAVARHHHDITFSSFRRRQERAGESAAIFYAKHPELGDFLAVPQALRFRERPPLSRALLARWAGFGERWDVPGARGALDRVLREDYLRGLRRGLEARTPVAAPAVSLPGRQVT